MKYFFFISVFIISTCTNPQKKALEKNALYFYFDANSKYVVKNYSGYNKITNKGIGELKYNFRLDSTNIIFVAKDLANRNNPTRIKISSKDTNNLIVKNFEWMNTYASNWRNIVKLRNSDKEIYIIEKDTMDNKLYLINVVYIEEIE